MTGQFNHWFGNTWTKWKVMPIRQVAKLGTGHTPSRANEEYWQDCTIPWVTVEDIRRHGQGSFAPLEDTEQCISELGLENSAAVLHPKGTVMLSRTASIGLSCITGRAMATTQAFVTWTPDERLICGDYLHAAIKAMAEQYDYLAYGATHLTIYFPDIKTLRVPVPPLEDQRLIAAFLKRETLKIDALIVGQVRLIELLQEKRESVISHAVTKGLNTDVPMRPSGVDWLGDVPVHWVLGPLKRFWGVTDCKHITAEFVDEGVPVASIREVQGRWVELENARQTTEDYYAQLIEGGRLPLPGDLIFSRNATVGEVAQVNEDHPRFALGQDVVLMRKLSADYSSDFLQYVIRSPVVTRQLAAMMIGSTFKRINVEEIRTLILPFPPSEEQARISAFLETELARFAVLCGEAQRAIDLLRERRVSLISAAVTGQIDVRGCVEQEAA